MTGSKLIEALPEPLSTAGVLHNAWVYPFSTKSDYARLAADFIGMAASDGLITTKVAAGLYGRTWQITPAGLKRLYALMGLDEEGEE